MASTGATFTVLMCGFFAAHLSACGIVTISGNEPKKADQTPDDGFRARLAAGCTDTRSCMKLETDARSRHMSCSAFAVCRSTPRLAEMQADLETAQRLRAEQSGRDAKEKQDQDALHAQEAREWSRLNTVAKGLSGACPAPSALELAISAIPASFPSESREKLTNDFHKLIERNRALAWHDLARELRSLLKRRYEPTSWGDVDADAAEMTKQIREMVAGFQCASGESFAELPKIRSEVDAWTSKLESDAEAEKRCRATECAADRAARPLCEALEIKRGHQADLARERANPSGVVNLTFLNRVGSMLQEDDDRIKEARAAYRTATKVPFSESRCKKK